MVKWGRQKTRPKYTPVQSSPLIQNKIEEDWVPMLPSDFLFPEIDDWVILEMEQYCYKKIEKGDDLRSGQELCCCTLPRKARVA